MGDDSWRNRKTLILGRTDMIGLLTPAEYNDCVEHAFRMHGLGRVYMEPKGHIVLDRYPGRMGGDALLHRGARGGGLQVGLDPRGQREVRPARRLLDPRLHASRDRLPARDLRRLAPHADAHGRVGGRLGEMARAQGLDRARDRGHRQRRQGDARHLRRRLPVPRGARLEQDAGVARPLRRGGAAPLPASRAQALHGRSSRSCAEPTSS